MCCQTLLDLIFGAISCQCPFLTYLSRWFKAYILINTGISGIILSSPQATLTTAFWNHEVTKWHLRTEATHCHVMRFNFHYNSATSTMHSIFWYLLGLPRSTTHFASITLKLTASSTVMIYPTSMSRRVIFWNSDMRSGDFASWCRGRLQKSRGGWGMTIESILINTPWQIRRQRNTSCFAPTSKKICIYIYIHRYEREGKALRHQIWG